MSCNRCRPPRRRKLAFTLVELLVVMGIIATLVSILLPVIAGAQKSVRAVQCASNIRQVCAALINYSATNRGVFPPYVTSPYNAVWHNDEYIGRYIPNRTRVFTGLTAVGGPVFTCPEDDRSIRSYAMNLWTSSYTSDAAALPPSPKGELWRSTVFRRPTEIILMTERWSTLTGPGIPSRYFFATSMIGGQGDKPGQRFGMSGGVPSTSTHWGPVACELPYLWHHRKGDGPKGRNAYGRVNIGYVDGHVEMKTADQLADRVTGLSRLDSWWSPWDKQQNVP